MEYTYFSLYKKYYDALLNNTTIVADSVTLNSDCLDKLSTISNAYFSEINDSKWQELAKIIIVNTIFLGLKSNINKLCNFISDNLVSVCDLSINTLLPTTTDIMKKDEELYNLRVNLNSQNNYLSQLESQRTNTSKYIFNEETKTNNLNPDYEDICNRVNNQINVVNSIKKQISKKIEELKALCEKANNTINNILSLDGSDELAASILPNYNSIKNGDDLNSLDLIDISALNNGPLTLESLVEASKSGVLPFTFSERYYEKTEDGGFRVKFTYNTTVNGKRIQESGFLLVPFNASANNCRNIFSFYSGSNGMGSLEQVAMYFGNSNPPAPTIVFHRPTLDVRRTKFQLEATVNAVEAFKNYLGTENSNCHLLGHSMGAQECNEIIARNPNFFETATIFNGSIKFKDEELLTAYQHTSTNVLAVVSTEDKNVETKTQLQNYLEDISVNTNLYFLPKGETGRTIRPNGKNYTYDLVNFDEMSIAKQDELESLAKRFKVSFEKKYDIDETAAAMNMFIIPGGDHTQVVKGILRDSKWWDNILNNYFNN